MLGSDACQDVDWAFVFRIDPDGRVHKVSSIGGQTRFDNLTPDSQNALDMSNPSSFGGGNSMRKIYDPDLNLGPLCMPEYSDLSLTAVTTIKEGRYIELGTAGIMLNVITPLQKFSRGGVTISDVIQQRFLDLNKRRISEDELKRIEAFFTSKGVSFQIIFLDLITDIHFRRKSRCTNAEFWRKYLLEIQK